MTDTNDPTSPNSPPKQEPKSPGETGPFHVDMLAMIIGLITAKPLTTVTEAVMKVFTLLRVEKWDDLIMVDLEGLRTTVENNPELAKVLSDTRLTKLLTIVDYAKAGDLTTATTFRDIVKDLKTYQNEQVETYPNVALATKYPVRMTDTLHRAMTTTPAGTVMTLTGVSTAENTKTPAFPKLSGFLKSMSHGVKM